MSEQSIEELVKNVRKRPRMYFENTSSRGVEQIVYELVGNVLDLYLMQKSTYVNVGLDSPSIIVEDDGPGFPFDQLGDTPAGSLTDQLFRNFHSTASHDSHAPHVHLTTLGCGLAPVVAVSAPLIVRSWRNGALWEQVFSKGFPEGAPAIIDRGSGKGTTIIVTPDPEIFNGAKPREHELRHNLFEMAHVFGGLKVGFQEERFYAPQGLYSLARIYQRTIDVAFSRRYSSPFHAKLKNADIEMEVVVFGDLDQDYKTSELPTRQYVFSWVNGAKTIEHGTHVRGLRNALKAANWNPEMMLIHVIMHNPVFAGPTGTKLDVPHVTKIVRDSLKDALCHHREKPDIRS
jgi:DNA gyrase subunit B